MKRTIKFLSLALALTVICQVADANPRHRYGRSRGGDGGLYIGGHAGINIANQRITTGSDSVKAPGTRDITGLNLGATVGYSFSEMFAVQAELKFLQKGFDLSEEIMGIKFSSQTTMNYLEIPVLAKVSFGESFKFFLNAGPSLGIALTGKSVTEVMGQKEEQDLFEKNAEGKTAVSRMDFSLAVGGGIGIQAGPGTVGLEVRYLMGMSNLLTEPDGSESLKNEGFGITLGYTFPIQ
jgi:hypothetical protein